jgi:hypothetical protein
MSHLFIKILLYRYNSYIYKNYNGRGVSKIMSSLQKFHRRTNGGAPAVKLIGSEAPVAGSGFYLGLAGDGTSYMYVAPKSTETQLAWGSSGTTRGTVSTTNGLANTNTLYSFGQAAHPAAYYCKTLTTGGYNTWYLPASSEMLTMYSNKSAVPFATSNSFVVADAEYLSSTENNSSTTKYQSMNGGFGNYRKDLNKNVRAVRRSTI